MTEKTTETNRSKGLDEELAALKGDVLKIREDIGALTDALKEIAAGYAGEAKARVGEQAAGAKEQMNAQIDQALGAGKKAVGNLEQQIGQRPIVSLLTAASVGFVLAKLLDLGSRR